MLLNIAIAAALVLIVTLFLVLLVRRNIYLAGPDELLVFTGLRRTIDDPAINGRRTVSHRLLSGGSAFRIPVLERVDRLSLAEMSIRLAVDDAYDREVRMWRVSLLVNSNIAASEPGIERAIERFLGMTPGAVKTIVMNTIEARLRNLLVTHDLADRLAWPELEHALGEAVASDLAGLGIEVDNLIFEGPPLPALPGEPENGSPRRNVEG